MWSFQVAVRVMLELRKRYADKGGFRAVVIRIRLPDGTLDDQKGTLDFEDNTVAPTTDTVILRGSIANPPLGHGGAASFTERQLVEGEFVTVLLEGHRAGGTAVGAARRGADRRQQGDYVYTLGADNKVQQTRVQLGQSTPVMASVLSGLTEGQMVVLDGIQRARPGLVVAPGPASPPLAANPPLVNTSPIGKP